MTTKTKIQRAVKNGLCYKSAGDGTMTFYNKPQSQLMQELIG